MDLDAVALRLVEAGVRRRRGHVVRQLEQIPLRLQRRVLLPRRPLYAAASARVASSLLLRDSPSPAVGLPVDGRRRRRRRLEDPR